MFLYKLATVAEEVSMAQMSIISCVSMINKCDRFCILIKGEGVLSVEASLTDVYMLCHILFLPFLVFVLF